MAVSLLTDVFFTDSTYRVAHEEDVGVEGRPGPL